MSKFVKIADILLSNLEYPSRMHLIKVMDSWMKSSNDFRQNLRRLTLELRNTMLQTMVLTNLLVQDRKSYKSLLMSDARDLIHIMYFSCLYYEYMLVDQDEESFDEIWRTYYRVFLTGFETLTAEDIKQTILDLIRREQLIDLFVPNCEPYQILKKFYCEDYHDERR